MNRNPSGLLFSLCIDGFVKYKTAEGLSQRTVDSYEWVLRKWMEKIGDQPVGKITSLFHPLPATNENRSPWGYGFLIGLRVDGYEKSLLGGFFDEP